tara:strand:+ start:1030 stop:1857 length:828 start_codon:yes stop_codon:yes gene_type:complete
MLRKIYFFLIFWLLSCSSDEQVSIETQFQSEDAMYREAFNELKAGNYQKSSDLFNELDLMHPYSRWAAKGQLMSGFALYQANKYEEAIFALNKFINLNPNDKNLDYAFYLKGYCYYERMNEVSRDQVIAKKAIQTFNELKNKFPTSKYSLKAVNHIKLLNNQLAGYEMNVGKFYQSRNKFLAAILRYKTILKKHKNSAQIPESLYRILECYISIGLQEQAIKVASIIKYNFPKSVWYDQTIKTIKSSNIEISQLEKSQKNKEVDLEIVDFENFDF